MKNLLQGVKMNIATYSSPVPASIVIPAFLIGLIVLVILFFYGLARHKRNQCEKCGSFVNTVSKNYKLIWGPECPEKTFEYWDTELPGNVTYYQDHEPVHEIATTRRCDGYGCKHETILKIQWQPVARSCYRTAVRNLIEEDQRGKAFRRRQLIKRRHEYYMQLPTQIISPSTDAIL